MEKLVENEGGKMQAFLAPGIDLGTLHMPGNRCNATPPASGIPGILFLISAQYEDKRWTGAACLSEAGSSCKD